MGKIMPELTYKTDEDDWLVEFFADGKLITTWPYEDDAEHCFLEFKLIFNAGYNAAKSK